MRRGLDRPSPPSIATCSNSRSKSLDASGGGDRPRPRQTPPPRNAIELSSLVGSRIKRCDERLAVAFVLPLFVSKTGLRHRGRKQSWAPQRSRCEPCVLKVAIHAQRRPRPATDSLPLWGGVRGGGNPREHHCPFHSGFSTAPSAVSTSSIDSSSDFRDVAVAEPQDLEAAPVEIRVLAASAAAPSARRAGCRQPR